MLTTALLVGLLPFSPTGDDSKIQVEPVKNVDSFNPGPGEPVGFRLPESSQTDLEVLTDEVLAVNLPQVPDGEEAFQMIDLFTGAETIGPMIPDLSVFDLWVPGRAGSDSEDEQGDDELGTEQWSWDLNPTANPTAYPFRTNCRIFYDDPVTGLTYGGSGTLIDASHVITSGNVVHQGPGGTWNTNIRVYPAWDGDDDAFGYSTARTLGAINGWINNGSSSGNMGFIGLERPVGFLTGWLGRGYWNDNSTYLDKVFNLFGYPTGCYSGAPNQMYGTFGTYDVSLDNELQADVFWTCTSTGMQGAASYWISGQGTRFVMGNHSTRCYGCNPEEIYHPKFTSARNSWYANTFMPTTYPTDAPDYCPLDVDSDSSANAGVYLSGFSFLLTNPSLYDPPSSQNIGIEVYLSTNDYISTSDTLIATGSANWNADARDSIRVNLGGVRIPSDTPSGQFYLGVIVSHPNDPRSSNNNTESWDSQPISITGCEVDGQTFGSGYPGSGGYVPNLYSSGSSCLSGGYGVTLVDGLGSASGNLWIGVNAVDISPPFGGHFYVDLSQAWISIPFSLNGSRGNPGTGWVYFPGSNVTGYQGLTLYLQATLADPGASNGVSLSNGLALSIEF